MEETKKNVTVPDGILVPNLESTKCRSLGYLEKNFPEFLEWLFKFYPYARDLRERIYLFRNDMLEAPRCPVCGKFNHLTGSMKYTKHCSPHCGQMDPETKRKTSEAYSKKSENEMADILEKRRNTNTKRYGVDNVAKLEDSKDKAKRTSLERYGTESPMQSKDIKEKSIRTNIERYGAENPMQSEEIKNRAKNTLIEKYGVDNPTKSKEIIDKRKRSNLEKYGTENPGNLPENIEKRKRTSVERYGVDNPSKSPEVIAKISETTMSRYGVMWPCMIAKCSDHQSDSAYNTCFERILENLGFVKDRDFTREFNVDGLIYDFKVGDTLIEINPSATHNSTWGNLKYPSDRMSNMTVYKPKKRTYHIGKTRIAINAGYRCISVWEWDDPERVAKLLLPRDKMYARDCEIGVIVPGEEKEFLDTNHLQGSCNGAEYCIGLYNDGELVEVMTFGRPRYNKNYQWELLRLCTKSGLTVIGGTEKLFKHFIDKKSPESVISYCDLSKFSGKIYEQLGFVQKNSPEPSKHWSLYRPRIIKDYSDPDNPTYFESSDNRNRNAKPHITDNFLRQRGYDQIFRTNIGKGVSNEELMERSGYVLVWDCGQATYVWRPDTATRD